MSTCMRNPIGRTKCKSLVKACEEGYTDIVKELLKYDVDINEAIDDGDSPLFTACWSGHEEVVQVLLSHKEIDVNKRSNVDNLTPLYIASQEGYHEIVDLLLLVFAFQLRLSASKIANNLRGLGFVISFSSSFFVIFIK